MGWIREKKLRSIILWHTHFKTISQTMFLLVKYLDNFNIRVRVHSVCTVTSCLSSDKLNWIVSIVRREYLNFKIIVYILYCNEKSCDYIVGQFFFFLFMILNLYFNLCSSFYKKLPWKFEKQINFHFKDDNYILLLYMWQQK